MRRLLGEARFTGEGIQEALGTSGERLASLAERPVHLRQVPEEGALPVLIRLFLLGAEVAADVADRSLGTPGLEALLTLGLVEEEGAGLRRAVQLVPHDDLLVASDPPSREAEPDHVPGLHRPSVTLAHLTVRRPAATALDLGTGCGIQALLAARHSGRVTATDVNERALEFADLNAALNGIENLELLPGSYLDPVEGRTFDLVVANPPYVISPESAFVFRDSGLGGDRVSEQLARELPAALAEGGYASLMVSWAQEEDAEPRPARWLAGGDVDALLLHSGTDDPLATAASWNRDLAGDDEAYGAAIDRWVAYFAAEGIGAIAYGTIVMRRRQAGPGWSRTLALPQRPLRPAHAHLERLFAAYDLLASTGDAALLGVRLRLVDGAVIEQRRRRAEGDWGELELSLSLDEGLPFSATLDPQAAALVAALDGERELGDAVAAIAPDDEEALPRAVALARRMLEAGFLEPAER